MLLNVTAAESRIRARVARKYAQSLTQKKNKKKKSPPGMLHLGCYLRTFKWRVALVRVVGI